MNIADAHCDVLYRLMQGQRTDVTPGALRAGRVGLQICAAFAGAQGVKGTPYRDAMRQLDILDELCGGAWPSLKKAEGAPMRLKDGVTYALPSIEGGEALEGSLSRLHEFYARGVRVVTLVWNHENELAHPAVGRSAEGLKPAGKQLAREMARLGVAVDVSHLNERGFYDLADMGLPIMAPHSNARALCGHPRNLTDEQLKLIAQSGGFVGVNFYSAFLSGAHTATLEDIMRHVDYMLGIAGDGHLGFGSDFDGIDASPAGVETPAHFPAVADALKRRGYGGECLAGICAGNLVNFLTKTTGHNF